jgi:hypothetical protein
MLHMASCRGATVLPTFLQVASLHSPARGFQTSPIAMGQMPPPGFDMVRRVDCIGLQGWHVGHLFLEHGRHELNYCNRSLLAGLNCRLDMYMLVCPAA